jgi:hypothetical protein
MENQKTGAAVYRSFSNQRLGYEGQVAVRAFYGTIFWGAYDANDAIGAGAHHCILHSHRLVDHRERMRKSNIAFTFLLIFAVKNIPLT